MATPARPTRRALLRFAGAAAGAAALSACGERSPVEPTHLIIVTTPGGVTVLNQDGRVMVPPQAVAVATPGWELAVTAQPDRTGTRVVVQDLAAGRILAANTLGAELEPRVVSPDGRHVASVTPGGAGIYGLHEPGGRDRTTVVVSGPSGERTRHILPGNVEPEAFSPEADQLFVLDYPPADRPERFRVQALDLTTGRLTPLSGRSGGSGGSGGFGRGELRAHRVDRVYDPRRSILFSLYAYEQEALAFVQCLHLGEGWLEYVRLPVPFGRERPGVHAIALSPAGDRLCVVHAPSANVADIDADRLVVTGVAPLAGAGLAGKPNVRLLASGELVVNVDNLVIATGPRRELATPGPARGLVIGDGHDIWAGHPQGVVRYNLATGTEVGRLTVPELYSVKHVRLRDW